MPVKGSRYVRPQARTSGPAVVACATAETAEARGGRAGRTAYLTGVAAWVTLGRRHGTDWRGSDSPIRIPLSSVWDWFDRHCHRGKRLYVVSPCASDFLTLMRFWDQTDRGRYRVYEPPGPARKTDDGRTVKPKPWVGRLVLKGTPDIITCRSDRGTMTFVSLSNFADECVRALAATNGVDLGEGGAAGPPDPWVDPDPAPACKVVTRHFRALVSGWVKADSGQWRDTTSQLAVSLWRKNFYTEEICRHEDDDASFLEAEALHGGRATAYCLADVGFRLALGDGRDTPPPRSVYPTVESQAHRLDVRSMYPAHLACQRYPVRLLSVVRDVGPDSLPGMLKHWCCLATVTLSTSADEYPLRYNNRTIYPTGDFVTTLAGPELEAAVADGVVRRVHALARYEPGHPFREYASWLLAERRRARDAGDPVRESFIKRLSNSFGGKFAQRSDRWVPRPKRFSEVLWGSWAEKDATTGRLTHWRALAGLPHERVSGRPGGQLLASVFAYLTAYGRVQMRRLRDTLGRACVLSQDTDGLWVTDEGLARARSYKLLSDDTPGMLRLVSSHTFVRWFDAQHYYCDGRWTLAGYAAGFRPLEPGWVEETTSVNPVRANPRRAPGKVARTTRAKTLQQVAPPGRVGPDGWVIAPVMSLRFDGSTDARPSD